MSLTKVTYSMIDGAYANVNDFGATGDGVTDDTVAIQATIDSLASSGGVVYFPPGQYRIARNIGVNDRWGIKVTNSNITLKGEQATLRRFNTDISTFALAYPILFVGVPDSNVAAQTANVIIDSLYFIGENTRHTLQGNALSDFRNVIEFKNTKNTLVLNCTFNQIDSSAINYQDIATFDYANSVYYNTTKNYVGKIRGCTFLAEPHVVPGRALLHCINANGIDGLVIDSNYFEWTDVCLSGESTYDTQDQSENDTFTYSGPRAALGAVKRSSRDVVFSNNNCFNCSEHPLYPAMVNVVISGNTISTDTPTICNAVPIQLRCRGATVTGNIITGYNRAISISEPSSQITFSGNSFYANDVNDTEGGAVGTASSGLASYIANRGDYLTYIPMGDIAVTGNVFVGPKTLSPTSIAHQIGARVVTAAPDLTNFPDGQIININISGNTFKNWQNNFRMVRNQYTSMVVSGNSFYAKPFTRAGFDGSTVMGTYAVILVSTASQTDARNMTFSNNFVEGAKYLFATETGAGTPNNFFTPEGIIGNRFNYIQNIKTADVRNFIALTRFRNNTGLFFLDRTWGGQAMENSLSDGATSNSELRYVTVWSGSAYLFYTDDAGTFVTLS
jgi:hypothetical protein